ncbi:DUF4232 domain-containing protein [Sciscionella marina]|uniref:DUF4232 domain-containing protein n=1 Tax=Sciscionella marina TaxID=508770 RepID=UPI0003641BE9|nr:DUF4232 domain-containing protein [Sciscionella marina]
MRYRVLLAGGAAAALLGLIGCGQLENNTASSPSSSSQAPSSPPAPPSMSTESPAPSTSSSSSDVTQDPSSPNTCKAPDLKLALGTGDAAAGTAYRPLTFTNKSTKPCTIQGYPGISYVGGNNGAQIGQDAKRVGGKGGPITLQPGASASANIGFVQVHNFDASACKPTPVRGLRVYPPHDTAAMFVPTEGTGCAGNTPDPQLTVATVQR